MVNAGEVHLTLTPVVSEIPSRISRAAIVLFARQGYHGTSTREIARLADVSEVTVFRYFECKEDIFLSALQTSFSGIHARLASLDRNSENRLPQAVLPKIMSLLVDTTTISPELGKLVAVALLELHGKAEDLCYAQLAPLFAAITRYLKAGIEKGELRELNPGIVAAAMALTVIAQPELSKLVADSGLSRMSNRESIDEYAKFWLKVLAP
jgi:AcrR family transcriptional regulator